MERIDFNDLRISATPDPEPAAQAVAEPASQGADQGKSYEVSSAGAPAPAEGTDTPPAAPLPDDAPTDEPAADTTLPLGELTRGVLRHDDYTRKTQHVAELARAAAVAKAQLEAKLQAIPGLESFAKRLDEDPDFAEAVEDIWNRQTGGSGPSLRAAAAEAVAPMDPRISELEMQLQSITKAHLAAVVDQNMRALQGRHHLSNADLAKVEQVAVDVGLVHAGMSAERIPGALEAAYRVAFFDRASTRGQQQLLRTTQASQQDARRGAVPATSAPRPEFNTAGKNLRQVAEAAKQAGRRGL